MSKSSQMFLDEQEQRYYANEGALKIGFIGQSTSAHYKAQDQLHEIQTRRIKLDMLVKEIANTKPQDTETEAYCKLVIRAEEEKFKLSELMDVYILTLEKMWLTAGQEQTKLLLTPVMPADLLKQAS